MYIPADLPVCQPTCSFDVFLPTSHEHPHMPPSTGLYTRFTFCSMYTQAYSKLSVPLHYDAFLPAKQSDLPVDSTTRLNAHRSTCSSAYQFFFPFRFNLCTYLRTHLLVIVPTDLRTPKYMYLLILILSFRLTTKTYRSTQPHVHIPIGATVFHPTCSFCSFHYD